MADSAKKRYSRAPTHPDLMTRVEAAELLGVSPRQLAAGFGPPPLLGYRRPIRYSREHCELWLSELKGASWDSTSVEAQSIGGAASKSPAPKSENRLARQIAARLRLKSDACARTTKARHLIVVPTGRGG